MLKKLAVCAACVVTGGLVASGTASAHGTVYGMTNTLGSNAIVAYHRANDGTLTFMQQIATGGGGSGVQLDPTDSLGSQGGVLVDPSAHLLFAVNTESLAADSPTDSTEVGDCQAGTISSFTINRHGGLAFASQVSSGGLFPSSLTLHGSLLYVLNAGGPGVNPACGIGPNITGFHISPSGRMKQMSGSTKPIDPGTSPGSFLNCDPGGFPTNGEFDCGLNPPAFPRSPAQVGFAPDGQQLVVTVKGTNKIYVFPVSRHGRPGAPNVTQIGDPTQPTPFGFAFPPNGRVLIVGEPFGASATIPAANASAVSSFRLGSHGSLEAVSSNVPNGQALSCWVAIEPRGRYAYVSNNGPGDISIYKIGHRGQLTLLQTTVAGTVTHPNDLAIASDRHRRFLYALGGGDGTVAEFRINGDGTLTSLGSVGGLPVDAGAQGLAGY